VNVGSDTVRRRASKADKRVGLAAVTAARLGTKPRSAAMPSSSGREAVGASSGVRMWRFMAPSSDLGGSTAIPPLGSDVVLCRA
jgi:hypothetical protein